MEADNDLATLAGPHPRRGIRMKKKRCMCPACNSVMYMLSNWVGYVAHGETCQLCGGSGDCPKCDNDDTPCPICSGSGQCPLCDGEGICYE